MAPGNVYLGVGDGITPPKNSGHSQGQVTLSSAPRNAFSEVCKLLL